MLETILSYIVIDNPLSFFIVILQLWWIWLPLILWKITKQLYFDYIRGQFISENFAFDLLEIVLEKGEEKTPKYMEKVLTTLHGAQTSYSWWEQNVKGAVPDMFSLEIISIGGDIHFLVRTLKKYRKLVESAIYGGFPDVDIVEVSDYTADIDRSKLEVEYDVFGTDIKLAKSDAYPIRTYTQFLDSDADGKINDPLSQMLEVMSHIDKGEQIWVQFPIESVKDDWTNSSKKELEKLLDIGVSDSRTWLEKWVAPILEVLTFGLMKAPTAPQAKEQKFGIAQNLTPGKSLAVQSIEQNMTKPGFRTVMRVVYLADKPIFNPTPIQGILGAIKQFGDTVLNSFTVHEGSITSVDDFFARPKKNLVRLRKNLLLDNYSKRKIADAKFVFNTEELTTVFHFPGSAITTGTLKRVQAKRVTPPRGLPLVE